MLIAARCAVWNEEHVMVGAIAQSILIAFDYDKDVRTLTFLSVLEEQSRGFQSIDCELAFSALKIMFGNDPDY